MDWLVFLYRDSLVWLFENTLEPLGNDPNTLFLFLMLGGATFWMFMLNINSTKKRMLNPERDKNNLLYYNSLFQLILL